MSLTKVDHSLTTGPRYSISYEHGTLVKPLLPARTAAKVSLFRADHQDAFLQELLSRVSAEQIPPWAGGEADEPWPYGLAEGT